MSYLRFQNSVIDKVERWEQRSANGNTERYNQRGQRNQVATVTSNVQLLMGVLYIGAPVFGGFLFLSWLPLSPAQMWAACMIFSILILIFSVTMIVRLHRRGHRISKIR